jgi:hypothetical protein
LLPIPPPAPAVKTVALFSSNSSLTPMPLAPCKRTSSEEAAEVVAPALPRPPSNENHRVVGGRPVDEYEQR